MRILCILVWVLEDSSGELCRDAVYWLTNFILIDQCIPVLACLIVLYAVWGQPFHLNYRCFKFGFVCFIQRESFCGHICTICPRTVHCTCIQRIIPFIIISTHNNAPFVLYLDLQTALSSAVWHKTWGWVVSRATAPSVITKYVYLYATQMDSCINLSCNSDRYEASHLLIHTEIHSVRCVGTIY